MAIRMQQRTGTYDQWNTSNPVLNGAEIGYESDTNKFKIGDGSTNWNDLPYFLDEVTLETSLDGYIPSSLLGANNGVAQLNSSGKLVSTQIPNVDEITQDAINTALVAGTGLDKTYDDNANTITLDIDSTVATKTYADGVAGAAQVAAELTASGALSAHASDSTSVHGITDTAELATKAFAASLLTGATKTNISITGDKDGLTISAENGVADSTTSDLAEGTNLYFTDERAQDAVGNNVGSGLAYADSTGAIGINYVTLGDTLLDGVSGASYGFIGTSEYLNVKNTNGYNKEIELDIAAVESQLDTDGYITDSSTSTLTNKTLTSPVINGATVGGDLVPSTDATYDLGSSTNKFKDLYLSGTTLYLDEATIGLHSGNIQLSHSGNTTTVPIGGGNHTVATESYVDTAVSNLVDGAGPALDTLNELAAAINDDASYAATITTALGNKQDKVSGVSDTEIGYLDGATSNIQAQIDAKLATSTAASTYAPLISPTLVTPVLGVATATSINGTTIPSSKTLITSDTTAYVSTAGSSVISANSSGNALEIRQTGAGKALVIEDEANPDSTPFVVAADGKVGIGVSNPTGQPLEIGSGSFGARITRYSATSYAGSGIDLRKSSSGTVGTDAAVANGDRLGRVLYSGYDGTQYISPTEIGSDVDGTVSTGAIPSRLFFSTSDTSGVVTERMRINSSGYIGVNNSLPETFLHVASASGTSSGSALMISGQVNSERLHIRSTGNTGPGTSVIGLFGGRNTISSPTATQSGDQLGYYQLGGYDGTTWIRASWITGAAEQNWTSTARGSNLSFSTTPNNTTSVTERMRITQDGRIVGVNSAVLDVPLVTNAQAASYTLVLADGGKLVEISNASANNLTVPLNSSVAYPVGTQINILQTGAGQTTVVATGGVIINGTPGLKLRAQWSSATLIKRATDTWVLIGDLSA